MWVHPRDLPTEVPELRRGRCGGPGAYLDRSPPRLLEKVGVELATAGPAEAQRLCQRAQLILDLLAPQR